MEIKTQIGAIQEVAAELIVINLFEGVTAPTGATAVVDRALNGAIRELVEAGDFTGKAEQSALLYTHGAIPAKRVLLIGLGDRAKFNLDTVRRIAAAAAREARRLKVTRYCTIVHGAGGAGLLPEAAAQAVVEGTILGDYAFTELKSDRTGLDPRLEEVTLVQFSADQAPAAQRGAQVGQIVAESVCLARDLVNRPGNYLTPTALAEIAEQIAAEVGLTSQALDEEQMADLGMGALLGVAQGSNEPAKFIILEHNAERRELPAYVIVGKGITFDSGGISIKPSEGMELMKDDMSGAAITLGVMRAVALLKLPLRVVGLMPATENLPDGRAYKPGDVLTSMSGLTIEVISTDAEGRLILADALHYAKRYQPKAVVDLATLTGACVVALGHVTSGLMGNAVALKQALLQASAASGEKIWELPLYEEYAEQIKSDVADVKNSGGRPAGTITAGLFLQKFAQGYPWAHLDIAGTAWADKPNGYLAKGATAHGVRLLIQWLRDLASAQ